MFNPAITFQKHAVGNRKGQTVEEMDQLLLGAGASEQKNGGGLSNSGRCFRDLWETYGRGEWVRSLPRCSAGAQHDRPAVRCERRALGSAHRWRGDTCRCRAQQESPGSYWIMLCSLASGQGLSPQLPPFPSEFRTAGTKRWGPELSRLPGVPRIG